MAYSIETSSEHWIQLDLTAVDPDVMVATIYVANLTMS